VNVGALGVWAGLSLTLWGCGPSTYVRLVAASPAAAVPPTTLVLFAGRPQRHYEPLAYVVSCSGIVGEPLDELRSQAASAGAQAVIDLAHEGSCFSGTAVRFAP
jgi:hypothetical protein